MPKTKKISIKKSINKEQPANPLETMRHSVAHIMAVAVKQLFPDAKFGIGPTIEYGFYYDFDLPRNLVPDDLPEIEKKMKDIIKKDLAFKRKEMTIKEALVLVKKLDQPYKKELIEELRDQGEKAVSFYETGDPSASLGQVFIDLCRGPHIDSTKETGAFKLTKIAGAYWRGSEKNKMLQRIYGLAFNTKEELDNYLAVLVEAEKRDHRKLGRDLEIFTFSDEIGAGLPIWLPNGTVLRDELEKLAKEKENELGYERVSTPLIAKEDLFYKSGHLPHYRESMYSPMDIDGENYYLKPMNCPFHHTIYASKPRSYRELPLRLAEYGMCHRYEKSGELQGLFRVRSMMMNDAHIYVRPDQVKEEIKKVIELHEYYYKLFNAKSVSYRLSLHDPKDLGGKYVDMSQAWKENEQILREVLGELKVDFFEAENEAAFYGPKIDINICSVIGKEYTLGTVQLDFSQPQKFNLTYTDKDGKEKMPYCIHRAPLSVHERFIGFLIEHFAGAFPVWLAPVQVAILPVGSRHIDWSEKISKDFKKEGIRVRVDDANETIGNKIRKAEGQKIPYMLVVGDKEMEGGELAVRIRGVKEMAKMKMDKFLEKVKNEIKDRKAEIS